MNRYPRDGSAGSNPMMIASRWILAFAIAGSALAVGTVHAITLCIVTAALAIAAVLGWWEAEPMKVRSSATLLVCTGIGLTAYTALQCVPMPIAWLAAIAPHNADVWSRALSPLREPGPRWAPISLDPTATRVEILRGVAYLLAFVTAFVVARRREGVAFLSAAIVVTGLTLGAAALLHPAFGAHTLFGVFVPAPGVQQRHIAPLMNPNNLAGYLNVAFCLSFAAAIAPEPRVPRAIAGAAALLLAATQVWVASRGGVATMVLGAGIVVAIAYLTRAQQSRTTMTLALVTGLAMVAGVSLLVLSGSDEAVSELASADVSKLKLAGAALRAATSMPIFGCGRGAFESVFPAFRTDVGYLTYSHPENVVAQWFFEWGIPGAIGLLAIAYALRPQVVLARLTKAGGAWAGVVALTVQNFGDLGTEIPGLVLAGVTCAAIAVAGTRGRPPTWRLEGWANRPRRVAISAVVAAAIALALAAGGLGHGLHDDENAMRDAAIERHVSMSEVRLVARSAMLRHPAEPYIPYIASVAAAEHGENPIPWIAATLERARVYGPAHQILARVLAKRSPSQARLEYRLALEQASVWVDLTEAPRFVQSYSDAMDLVPEGKAGIPLLESLSQAIGPRLPATSFFLDLDQLTRSPTAYGPALRSATGAVDDLMAGDEAPWCQGSAREICLRDALSKAGRLQELRPDKCQGYALHAKAVMASGDAPVAVANLARATDRVTDRVSCLKALVSLSSQANDEVAAETALANIAKAGCGDAAECAGNLEWAGQVYERTGQPRKALALYRRAMEKKPDYNWYIGMAQIAAQAGFHAEAADDYEKLARWAPDHAEWRKLALAEHDAAIRDMVGAQ